MISIPLSLNYKVSFLPFIHLPVSWIDSFALYWKWNQKWTENWVPNLEKLTVVCVVGTVSPPKVVAVPQRFKMIHH